MRTLTDGSGFYELDSVIPGVYFLVASSSGYEYNVSIVHALLDSNLRSDLLLTKEHNAPHNTLTLHVMNAVTHQPITDAIILVDGGPSYFFVDNNGDSPEFFEADGTHYFQISATDYPTYGTWADFPLDHNTIETIAMMPHLDTLVARYTFNNNAVDSSGNSHNGTLHGGTFTYDRFGQASSALQFNGSTDYVSVPNAADLNFGDAKSFTFCFWVKCQAQASSTARYILRKMDSTTGMFLGYHSGFDQYSDITSYCGTTAGNFNGPSEAIGDDNKWHFITYVFDAHGEVDLYYDGSTNPFLKNGVDLQHAMRGPMPNNSPLMIGSDGSSRHAFKGIIDDIRIYRGALQSSKINALYHENGW